MNYEMLGRRIKKYRQELRMTQEQLAEAINLSAVYISQIEGAHKKLSVDTLVNIANVLKVPLEYLIRDSIQAEFTSITSEIVALLKGRSDEESMLVLEMTKVLLSRIKDNEVI